MIAGAKIFAGSYAWTEILCFPFLAVNVLYFEIIVGKGIKFEGR